MSCETGSGELKATVIDHDHLKLDIALGEDVPELLLKQMQRVALVSPRSVRTTVDRALPVRT